MEVTVRFFERIEERTGNVARPLDGVLTVEALPHRRTVLARIVIADLAPELAGQSLDLWGRCLRADNWVAAAEPPYLCLPVDFHRAQKRYAFDLPVTIHCRAFGQYEIAIYAGRTEIVRAALDVTLLLWSPRPALDVQGQLVD